MSQLRWMLASTLSVAFVLPCAAFQDAATSAPARPAAAQPAPPRDISSLLEPIIKKHKVPGMAAAIVMGWDVDAIGVDQAGQGLEAH